MKTKRWLSISVVGLCAMIGGVFVALRTGAFGQSAEKGLLGDFGGGGDTETSVTPSPGEGSPTDGSASLSKAQKQTAPPEERLPALDWVSDPELDALRMDVYKAELRARLLKATAEIRDYEKRLSGKPARDIEAPKPVAPPKPKPKLKLIAVDGKGAIVEVDGRTYSFDKPGDQEGKVSLKGVTSDRALIEVDGEDFEAKF
ncbi:MAG: hypothetical protein HYT87_20340 [Nitrospirae bacterium]|nr:hypothetical protein [Nitrospirota bacterium]